MSAERQYLSLTWLFVCLFVCLLVCFVIRYKTIRVLLLSNLIQAHANRMQLVTQYEREKHCVTMKYVALRKERIKSKREHRHIGLFLDQSLSSCALDHVRFGKSQEGLEVANPDTRSLVTWTARAALFTVSPSTKTSTQHAWLHYPLENYIGNISKNIEIAWKHILIISISSTLSSARQKCAVS